MRLAATAVALTAVLALAGCGGEADTAADAGSTPASSGSASGSTSGSASGSASGSPSDAAGTTIDVTVQGDQVTPNGERVPVKVGQPVVLKVTADKPGEIHVHSTPEQELEYQEGVTELTLTNLDQPGIITVESHTLDKVIVQLQVS